MKKLLINVLIISLINFFGCTTMGVATKESVEKEAKEGTLESELYIITFENNRYHFGKWGYQIKRDTLFGKGLKINPDGEEPFEGKIAMDDIRRFEMEEGDTAATIGLVLGIGAAALLAIGILYSIALGNSLESCSQQK